MAQTGVPCAAMFRWLAVIVLTLSAVFTGWVAQSRLAPRGVKLTVFDGKNWDAAVSFERNVRHVDFGPHFRANRLQLEDDSAAKLEGWLYAPRSGSYAFQAESDSDLWVNVGKQPVFRHKAKRKKTRGTINLKKGHYPFQIRIKHKSGSSFLRFKWQLPSGYMDMESFPPIFVQPEAPAPGPALPLALRLGPLLLALLAVGFALGPVIVGWLRRLGTDKPFRLKVVAAILVFGSALSFRCWELNGAGETSDEWAYAVAGRIYVSNIAHGYFQSQYWHSNEEHPPIGKYIYGAASHLAASDSFGVTRFASALMGSLTVLITFLFALRFINLWTGVCAGAVLCFLPHFVAHGKVAALDTPACLFFTWAVYLAVSAVQSKNRRSWRFLWAAIAGSLAFSVKFSNALVLVFLVLVHIMSEWKNIRKHGSLTVPLGLYVAPAIPLLLLLCIWPWLWKSPFGQLVDTLKHWDYPIQEWFLGNYRQPPWYYFPVCFLATTPSLLLIPMGAFIYRTIKERWFIGLVICLWFITPFGWTVSALKQDGIRYIYTMFPAFALMVGAGICFLAKTVLKRTLLIGLTSLYLIVSSWFIHPYYLNYYSEIVGGPSTVYKLSWFEIGWWGEGMDKAFEHLNEVAPHGATFDLGAVVTHTTNQLRDDIRIETKDPDYFLKTYLTPWQEEKEGYEEIMRLEIRGAPLVILYQRIREIKDMDK